MSEPAADNKPKIPEPPLYARFHQDTALYIRDIDVICSRHPYGPRWADAYLTFWLGSPEEHKGATIRIRLSVDHLGLLAEKIAEAREKAGHK